MEVQKNYLNQGNSLFRYFTNEEDAKSTLDLTTFFSPYGPFKRNYSYFGPGGILQMYASFTENYDVDYILNKLLGLSDLNTDFDKSLNVGGKGIYLHQAFISSISEMAERMFGSLAYLEVKDSIIYSTYKDLVKRGENVISPDSLQLFAKEQYESSDFQYEVFTEDSYIGWIEGERLFSKEKILVPAQLILLFYMLKPNETCIGYSTSGGLASNINFEETVYRGITELIERDAVNLRWTCNISPDPIVLDEKLSKDEFNNYKEKSELLGGEINYYLHTLDFDVPVVSAVQINPNFNRYAFIAGGGVDVDIEKAILSAFKEYGQSLEPILFSLMSPDTSYSQGMRKMLEVDRDADISNIDHFFKIMSFYGYRNNLEKLKDYFGGSNFTKFSDLQKKYPNRENKLEYLYNFLNCQIKLDFSSNSEKLGMVFDNLKIS
ncbi:hypothetical protein FFV08_10810 [Streptococcus sanguinis]|uniref:YcaO domain-containing protein n=1 Tax=Streptococcus sanguinis TaxID=1305 RepID=A0A7H8V9G9_STRSA|nr:hypothetical protein FFV08_10810 [Streptococcus sanguinis]